MDTKISYTNDSASHRRITPFNKQIDLKPPVNRDVLKKYETVPEVEDCMRGPGEGGTPAPPPHKHSGGRPSGRLNRILKIDREVAIRCNVKAAVVLENFRRLARRGVGREKSKLRRTIPGSSPSELGEVLDSMRIPVNYSQSAMADYLGFSREQLRGAVSKLIEADYIRTGDAKYGCNTYFLNDERNWLKSHDHGRPYWRVRLGDIELHTDWAAVLLSHIRDLIRTSIEGGQTPYCGYYYRNFGMPDLLAGGFDQAFSRRAIDRHISTLLKSGRLKREAHEYYQGYYTWYLGPEDQNDLLLEISNPNQPHVEPYQFAAQQTVRPVAWGNYPHGLSEWAIETFGISMQKAPSRS